uniref:SCP domain-containing protein n=1 Tax=Plectus sambesii TaxID=2011161 RepID=A0A914UIB1_9BILA
MSSSPHFLAIAVLLLLTPACSLSDFSDELFIQLLTGQHNIVRSMHNVAPLTLNNTISTRAQRWSDELNRLPRSGMCIFHSGQGGENIYYHWSTQTVSEQWLAEKAVVAFYEEIKQYNYNRPGFKVSTAHFTQMVWMATTQMGVGISRRRVKINHSGCGLKQRYDANLYFVVVQYEPHGNVIFQDNFKKNVTKPLRSVDEFLKKFTS